MAHFYANSPTNHSRGNIIFIYKKGDIRNISVLKVEGGDRIQVLSCEINEDYVILVNVSGPTIDSDKCNFFELLSSTLTENTDAANCNLIVAGDMNAVLDPNKDVIAGESYTKLVVNAFNHFVKSNKLVDIWCEQNDSIKQCTWKKANPFMAKRLDYIFVNDNVHICRLVIQVLNSTRETCQLSSTRWR